MSSSALPEDLWAAQVLALLVAANGSVDAFEIDRLQTLQAIARLGVDRERFARMAQRCVEEIGATSCERSWLRTSDLLYADALIDAVRDPDLRLLVCWLSAAAITADGRVSQDERLLYRHALARWRIRQDKVAQATRHDPIH
jgi:hypothetical protein